LLFEKNICLDQGCAIMQHWWSKCTHIGFHGPQLHMSSPVG